MSSLRSRLSIALFLSLIVAFSMLWFLVSVNVQFLSEEYIASRLRHDAETLLSAFITDNNGQLSINDSRVGPVYHQPFSGHYYIVSIADKTITSRSLWDYQLIHTIQETGSHHIGIQKGPEQQSLLVLSQGYNMQGQHISISVAEDINPIKENTQQFLYWFALIAVSMLVILVMLQIFILRISLMPLKKIQAELHSLEERELFQLSTDVPDELHPLINEFNHLLTVMEQRRKRSRNGLSDLAHAIKKPLTIIHQVIDKDDANSNSLLIKEQATHINHITDRILKRARLAGKKHTGSNFSFSMDMPALNETLKMMYTEKNRDMSLQIQENTTCNIEREDMLELLGNLLDNAYKWANNRIRLSAGNNEAELYITVEDDGTGAPTNMLNNIAQRGVRLDEKIDGYGFGLAIVTDIVRDYGGSIHFGQSETLGGFKVDIRLPA